MSTSAPLRSGTFEQRLIRRGDADYEATRAGSMWNQRVPARYPEVIVIARDVVDVVAAVRWAAKRELRVSVKSGGHSWSGNHLRDDGLLLDVAALDEVTVDRARRRATTGPGRKSNELAAMLGRQGLAFPTGHCLGVCVGGYLLQGGFGWNGRAFGPACMSVVGLDIVTAEGELLHASEEENADLFWAARGSGAGFFGVVTRFHLKVYDKPRVTAAAGQTFPLSALEPVLRWMHAIRAEVPASVELQLAITGDAFGVGGPGIELFAPVFANSLRDAWRALRFLDSPIRRLAKRRIPMLPVPLSALYRLVMTHYPSARYGVDNLWTHAHVDELLPHLEHAARTLPPPPSHLLWLNWSPPAGARDARMAFSMEDETYLALYGCWQRAEDDARYAPWAVSNVRRMQHLASGCQLADENLGERPARFVSDDHLQRLDAIRLERDPRGTFQTWMGRP